MTADRRRAGSRQALMAVCFVPPAVFFRETLTCLYTATTAACSPTGANHTTPIPYLLFNLLDLLLDLLLCVCVRARGDAG